MPAESRNKIFIAEQYILVYLVASDVLYLTEFRFKRKCSFQILPCLFTVCWGKLSFESFCAVTELKTLLLFRKGVLNAEAKNMHLEMLYSNISISFHWITIITTICILLGAINMPYLDFENYAISDDEF